MLVGYAGTRFVGAAASAENTAHCVPAQPDGRAESIACGPLAPTVMRPGAHLLLVGTLTAPVACGARFELDVSSDGVQPFARGSDLTPARLCSGSALRALTPPAIRGPGRTLTASPAKWSTRPTRGTYRWQACAGLRCVTIKGATGRSLHLTKRMRGRTLRVVATGTVNGTTTTSASRRVAVGL